MRLISEDLEVTSWSREEDPGDYPNNVASCPNPPGPWEPEGTSGCGIFLMDEGEWEELQEAEKEGHRDDFFSELCLNLDRFRPRYLEVERYHYERVLDFLIVVPEFKKCDSPSLEEERGPARKWLARKWRVDLPAGPGRALGELLDSSPDNSFNELGRRLDTPRPDPDETFVLDLNKIEIVRIMRVARKGVMPNAHGAALAEEALKLLGEFV